MIHHICKVLFKTGQRRGLIMRATADMIKTISWKGVTTWMWEFVSRFSTFARVVQKCGKDNPGLMRNLNSDMKA